jgi:hypothetical protein
MKFLSRILLLLLFGWKRFFLAVVLRKVCEKVMKTTGNKQQPWEYESLTRGALVLSAIKSK